MKRNIEMSILDVRKEAQEAIDKKDTDTLVHISNDVVESFHEKGLSKAERAELLSLAFDLSAALQLSDRFDESNRILTETVNSFSAKDLDAAVEVKKDELNALIQEHKKEEPVKSDDFELELD